MEGRTGNVDPVQPGDSTSRTGGSGNTGNPGPSVAISEPPPVPAPAPKPAPKVIRKTVLNGEALELPKPQYPHHKTMGVRGTVNVQVLIDEKAKSYLPQQSRGIPCLHRRPKRQRCRLGFHQRRGAIYQSKSPGDHLQLYSSVNLVSVISKVIKYPPR